MSLALLLVLAFLVTACHTEPTQNNTIPSVHVFSSCGTHNSTTGWTKGSRQPIRSWLNSIVPTFDSSGTSDKVYGKFRGQTANEIGLKNEAIVWRKFGRLSVDGWLYGQTQNGSFTGDRIAYIYSDFSTIIYGIFNSGTLVSGRSGKIIGYRCKNGIMELKFSSKLGEDIYKYEEVTNKFLTSRPTLVDPLERRQIFVDNSTVIGMTTGDGLFAKRNIPANSLVAIYAGFILDNDDTGLMPNMTKAEVEDHHKNWLTFNDTHMVDIPPFYTSIISYRASLGHKANHRFVNTNLEFCKINHPRFGLTCCLKSQRPLSKGEELFEHYGYDRDDSDAPTWYLEALSALEEE